MEREAALVALCGRLAHEHGIALRGAVAAGAERWATDALQRVGIAVAGAGEANLMVVAWGRDGPRAIGPAVDAVIVVDPPAPIAPLDRFFFDRGLLRIADPPGARAPLLLYLRSALIADPHATGGREEAVISMANLGHNAGFANQLFQYAFLKLYGLRNNAAVETPPWPGEAVFGIPHRPVARPLRKFKGDQWSVGDLALWTRARPPVNVDFWGYYQAIPESWQAHRAFLRRLFAPRAPWREPVERWLERHRPAGASLVAIHVRRGDYRGYDPAVTPWFRLIPEGWYRSWLEALWSRLAMPVLFVATDDRARVLPAFADYAPLTAEAAEAEMPEPRFLADFAIMAAADILAISNSSFSRMAAILAPPAQHCFIPAGETETFEPYDPWASDHFWQRFGAPAPRPARLLPRFLRRRA
jgi:hypothetical protein